MELSVFWERFHRCGEKVLTLPEVLAPTDPLTVAEILPRARFRLRRPRGSVVSVVVDDSFTTKVLARQNVQAVNVGIILSHTSDKVSDRLPPSILHTDYGSCTHIFPERRNLHSAIVHEVLTGGSSSIVDRRHDPVATTRGAERHRRWPRGPARLVVAVYPPSIEPLGVQLALSRMALSPITEAICGGRRAHVHVAGIAHDEVLALQGARRHHGRHRRRRRLSINSGGAANGIPSRLWCPVMAEGGLRVNTDGSGLLRFCRRGSISLVTKRLRLGDRKRSSSVTIRDKRASVPFNGAPRSSTGSA
jgi:hypothetical protein